MLPIVAASIAVLLPAAVPSAAVAARPTVVLDSCTTGIAPLDRSATYTASMTAEDGTKRMWMRFDLYERPPGSDGFRRVKAANFGRWERARRGVPAFTFTKRVDGLAAPAVYRVLVRYRWYEAGGRLARRASRRGPICRQPDPRPDLVVGRLDDVRAGAPDRTRYVVTVLNRGRGDAAVPFGVTLTVNGTREPAQSIATLGAGGTAVVSFVAPRCAPGSRVEIALDPDDAIDEVREADNVVTRPCPARP
jgi:hypothetical protein